jgi:hypothetical protein
LFTRLAILCKLKIAASQLVLVWVELYLGRN